jgi:hypothetical protein
MTERVSDPCVKVCAECNGPEREPGHHENCDCPCCGYRRERDDARAVLARAEEDLARAEEDARAWSASAARLEKDLADARHEVERLTRAATCASCGGLIGPPMQCGMCIEREAPVPGMPERPATTNLRERSVRAEAEVERLRVALEELADIVDGVVRENDYASVRALGLDSFTTQCARAALAPAKEKP